MRLSPDKYRGDRYREGSTEHTHIDWGLVWLTFGAVWITWDATGIPRNEKAVSRKVRDRAGAEFPPAEIQIHVLKP